MQGKHVPAHPHGQHGAISSEKGWNSCVDFHRLNALTKKDSYPLLQIHEALESMVGTVHFQQWTLRVDFGKSGWRLSPNSIPPSQWEIQVL